jgi:DNA (cytosine-5)-methyltransferase 1
MPTVVSLFSGAGGLDIGIALAGGSILAQIEIDPDCVETLKQHAMDANTGSIVVPQRLEAVSANTLRRKLGLRRGELTLLAGGPPCQPFTTAGLRKAINDARASSLFPRYLDFVDEFKPESLLIENVDGILSAALRHRPLNQRGSGSPALAWEERKGSFLYWLLSELAFRGYSVSWGVLEAADYGVPQLRQRAFLLGMRGSTPCFLPPPLFGRPGLPEYKTLRDGLSDLTELGPIQPLSKRKRDVFAMIPPGGNWRHLPEDQQILTMGAAFRATGGKSGWWRRLSWDAPAPTILGMPDHSSTALVHPDAVRCLSVHECAALQTLPTTTRFGGTPRSQYQQIGNAVPPLLSFHVAQAIFARLDGATQDIPPAPPWRKVSANRRIGTHGWVTTDKNGARVDIVAKVREDHVWANNGNRLDRLGSEGKC